jgi:hypothetical protein
MSTVFVTSHLLMGDQPENISGHVVPVDDADEAIQVLDSGGTALLPADSWDAAAEVLRHFGADSEHVDYQLAIARGA